MQITASMVKELRDRTGAGMMECKKVLTKSNGDMDVAIELMRKSGLAKADKRASRIAAEGVISSVVSADGSQAAIIEVNCETDFVSKGDDFRNFATSVVSQVLVKSLTSLEDFGQTPLIEGEQASIEQVRQELVAKIGENIKIRRFERVLSKGGQVGHYLHGNRIGVLIDIEGADQALAKDIAMHIAASRPLCVTENEVPKTLLEKEKEIFSAQAQASGKPANIIEKMVQGRLKKYLGEVTLLGQPFVKDPNQTVGKLLLQSDARVQRFVRFEVGEGIEKKTENFAEEVMAQVKGG
ncbi:MAG: elongation factor Ts [Gammaproteobacteria bacterium]|nr:elongation factor Ts [Gammaproteobacteria bacterium]